MYTLLLRVAGDGVLVTIRGNRVDGYSIQLYFYESLECVHLHCN